MQSPSQNKKAVLTTAVYFKGSIPVRSQSQKRKEFCFMSSKQWLQRECKEFPSTHLHLTENSPLLFLGHLALLETF